MTTPDRTPADPTASASPSVASGPALVEGVDVDALAGAVRACPSVAELSGGPFGAVATYLPGRRVTGVVVRRDLTTGLQIEVHVVAHHGPTMATVAEQVRSVIAAHAAGARVDVSIDDIDLPQPA